MVAPSSHPHDPRLTAFLDAASDADADSALAALFDDTAERVLADAVGRGLAGAQWKPEDAADIASDVRVRLIRKLWNLRRAETEPIADFLAYVATTATRTCYGHLRARYPARTRFRNQVRYSVAHHGATRLEVDAAGVWQCRSTAIRPAPQAGSAKQFLEQPAAFVAARGLDPNLPLTALIPSVLAALDAPVALDRFVDALAPLVGVADHPRPQRSPDGDDGIAQLADPAPDAARVLADREALEVLWAEIATLPTNQRAALLLNLRDPDGGAALHAFPATGLVTHADLAGALDLDDRTLAELWDRLPLDDLAIAAQLGLSRQQVINLRKSARARLARRTGRKRP